MHIEYGPSLQVSLGSEDKFERTISEARNYFPLDEDREGLVVNALKNRRVKQEVPRAELEAFVGGMHARIAQELKREKTTLPKDRLKQLEVELREEIVKPIIESFGYGVASDPFMLYGLIATSKELIKEATEIYNGNFGTSDEGDLRISNLDDAEIINILHRLWSTKTNSGREFPNGEYIQYYSGRDVAVDDREPRFDVKEVPGYRYIFGPGKKNKTDYARSTYPVTADIVRELAQEHLYDYALQFRNNEDIVGNSDTEIVQGYPAEWYIPASDKKKVLAEYFRKYVLPQIRKRTSRLDAETGTNNRRVQ